MSNPNPPNKFKKGEPRPAGAGRRPGAVNHLTTARVKTERKVRVVYQTVDEARAALRAKGIDPTGGDASPPRRPGRGILPAGGTEP